MSAQYFIRRDFADIHPFLTAVRMQADEERQALGFLPESAYDEAARQGKLIVLISKDEGVSAYAGHLLYGGVFPTLRVRQICIAKKSRRHGLATKLLRTLIAQGEKENYLSITANVATDLKSANAFYERGGFISTRLKAGGTSRGRTINVRILQLQTPSLISLMVGSDSPSGPELLQPRNRSLEVPIYTIDLNVFFDAIKKRDRSEDAGIVIKAALRHQIRLAATQELASELERTSHNPSADPVLSFARHIPGLPGQDEETIKALVPTISAAVFPDRSRSGNLRPSDRSDVLHLAQSVAAGVSGYITSDSKVLSARDTMMAQFGLDVIGLSEFVDLLDLPPSNTPRPSSRETRDFRIEMPSAADATAFIESEALSPYPFLAEASISNCERRSVSDEDGIIGVSLLVPSAGLEKPSHAVVCVRQEHPFSSTVADFLISEMIQHCSQNSACHLLMMDIPSHPITRRIALRLGFQPWHGNLPALAKVALGRQITKKSWSTARLSVERLTGLKLQPECPTYSSGKVKAEMQNGKLVDIELSELETLLSPTLLALPNRKGVVVPITRAFAADLLGTSQQYSFLEVPEAQFLSRRTYFNTTRAVRTIRRGEAIVFYESSKKRGRGAIAATGRIVDVTTIPIDNVPEAFQRGAVVKNLSILTKSKRILATTFDNLLPLKSPVSLKKLREIGCVNRTNFVTATSITASHLAAIVEAGNEKC